MSTLKVDANYLWQDEMSQSDESAPLVSDRAMEIAKAYDKMSSYGKSLIDKIVENEGRYKIMKVIPLIGQAAQDGTEEVKTVAKRELKELTDKEIAQIPSRIMR
jgi:hypothetical protein